MERCWGQEDLDRAVAAGLVDFAVAAVGEFRGLVGESKARIFSLEMHNTSTTNALPDLDRPFGSLDSSSVP